MAADTLTAELLVAVMDSTLLVHCVSWLWKVKAASFFNLNLSLASPTWSQTSESSSHHHHPPQRHSRTPLLGTPPPRPPSSDRQLREECGDWERGGGGGGGYQNYSKRFPRESYDYSQDVISYDDHVMPAEHRPIKFTDDHMIMDERPRPIKFTDDHMIMEEPPRPIKFTDDHMIMEEPPRPIRFVDRHFTEKVNRLTDKLKMLEKGLSLSKSNHHHQEECLEQHQQQQQHPHDPPHFTMDTDTALEQANHGRIRRRESSHLRPRKLASGEQELKHGLPAATSERSISLRPVQQILIEHSYCSRPVLGSRFSLAVERSNPLQLCTGPVTKCPSDQLASISPYLKPSRSAAAAAAAAATATAAAKREGLVCDGRGGEEGDGGSPRSVSRSPNFSMNGFDLCLDSDSDGSSDEGGVVCDSLLVSYPRHLHHPPQPHRPHPHYQDSCRLSLEKLKQPSTYSDVELGQGSVIRKSLKNGQVSLALFASRKGPSSVQQTEEEEEEEEEEEGSSNARRSGRLAAHSGTKESGGEEEDEEGDGMAPERMGGARVKTEARSLRRRRVSHSTAVVGESVFAI